MPNWYLKQEIVMYLFGIPMPPSSNNVYETIMIKGRPRRVKGKAFKAWLKLVDAWALRKPDEIVRLKAMLFQLKRTEALRVEATYWFKEERILTKRGKPKKLDVSNRVKCLHDKIAEILGIDDCLFWETYERKLPIRPSLIDKPLSYEWVDFNVSVIDLPRQGV